MICVSVGRTRHKMMVAEHRALAQRGAELVELRLDFLSHSPDLKRLLPERPTATLIACRRPEDKGRWSGSEEQRLTLLRAAIVAGVEYVDLEEDIAKRIPRYGPTKRVISYHNFEETPYELETIHERMQKLDPDVIKIVTMANSPADSVRMLRLMSGAKVPTVGFCMGDYGVFSRILTGKYGAPFTYATFSQDRELAPGQLSFEVMRDVYQYDRIGAQTEVFGVLGDPIGHSMSPLIHNAAFRALEMDAVYVPFRVPKDALPITLEQFKWLKVRGFSVTLPHKEAAVERAQHLDGPVQQIGAANTLYVDEGSEWWAANTDYSAALESLRLGMAAATPGYDVTDERFLNGRQVLMLGAGGVARAIGLGVLQSGGALTVCNRTHDRAKALAASLGCQQVSWENRGSVFADVLINCTPVGMHPDVDHTPFQENWMREGMLVFDTIYNPENTLLLKQARLRGCKVVNGVEMFVLQAAAQFQRFTGLGAPVEVMREAVRRGISAVR